MVRAWIGVVLVWLLAGAAPAAPRPIEDFAALPFMAAPEISPDGKRVAAKLSLGDRQVFAIMPLFEKTPPKLIALGELQLDWFTWVNDQWLAVGIGMMTPVDLATWYVRRAAGVSIDGKIQQFRIRDAGQNAGQLVWTASDGTPRILLAAQRSIYGDDPGFWPNVSEVDISTGKMRTVQVAVAGVRSWYADAGGIVRIGVGYKDATRRSRLLYRATASEPFRVVDEADGRKREQLIVPALFLDGDKALAFADDADGFGTIQELDLKTLQLGRTVFAKPGFDLDALIEGADRRSLAGIRYTADRAMVHWTDPAFAQLRGELDSSLGDRRATIVSMSRDRTA